LFGTRERLFIWSVEPAETREFTHSGSLKRKDRLRKIQAPDFGQVGCRARGMVALGPEPQAKSRRGAARASGALLRGNPADLLDEQHVDAPMRIVAGNSRQARVDDHRDAVDRQGGLGHIGGNNDLAPTGPGNRFVLLGGWKLTVKRKNQAPAWRAMAQLTDCPLNLVSARHENENVSLRPFEILGDGLRRALPRGLIVARLVSQVLDLHGKHS